MWHYQLENVTILEKKKISIILLYTTHPSIFFQSQYSTNMKETNCKKYISYSLPLFDM